MFTKGQTYELEDDWSFCMVGEEDDLFILQSKEGKTYAFDYGYGDLTIKILDQTYESLKLLQELEMSKVKDGTFLDRNDELSEIFYAEGNLQLEDPIVFDGDAEDDTDLIFDFGTEDQFENLIKLILLADFNIKNEVVISVTSATDEDSSGMEVYEGNIENENTIDLIKDAIEKFAPFGHTMEYNDGAYNRRSGYSKRSKYIEIKFRPQDYSNHERLESVKNLQEKLKEYGMN